MNAPRYGTPEETLERILEITRIIWKDGQPAPANLSRNFDGLTRAVEHLPLGLEDRGVHALDWPRAREHLRVMEMYCNYSPPAAETESFYTDASLQICGEAMTRDHFLDAMSRRALHDAVAICERMRAAAEPEPITVRVGADTFTLAPRSPEQLERMHACYLKAKEALALPLNPAALPAVVEMVCAILEPEVSRERLEEESLAELVRICWEELPVLFGAGGEGEQG